MSLESGSVQKIVISVLSLDASALSLPIKNALDRTAAAQGQVTRQLTTGSRINSGADDPAGLSIADGIDANVAALYQSAQNVTQGLGALQTADGALSTIVALLNRCVTLATEASSGVATKAQNRATDREFQSLLAEVNNVAVETSFNGAALFQPAYGVANRTIDSGSYIDPGNTIYHQGESVVPPTAVFTSDATTGGSQTYVYQPLSVDARALGLTANHGTQLDGQPQVFAANVTLLTQSEAQQTLTKLAAAITQVSAGRGTVGALVEQLQAAFSVVTTESQNLQSASSAIRSASIGAVIGEEARLSVLQQTGISALQQSEQQTKQVLKLLSQ